MSEELERIAAVAERAYIAAREGWSDEITRSEVRAAWYDVVAAVAAELRTTLTPPPAVEPETAPEAGDWTAVSELADAVQEWESTHSDSYWKDLAAELERLRGVQRAAAQFVESIDRCRELGMNPKLTGALWPFQKLRAATGVGVTVDNSDACPCCLGDRLTVCDACGQHSCWAGRFMCDKAVGAGVRRATKKEIEAQKLQRPIIGYAVVGERGSQLSTRYASRASADEAVEKLRTRAPGHPFHVRVLR